MLPLYPMIEHKFKVGDKVQSLQTGSVYTVTKLIGLTHFMHDKATNPKWSDHYTVFLDVCPVSGVHESIDVGFRFTKIVCKHCNKEM